MHTARMRDPLPCAGYMGARFAIWDCLKSKTKGILLYVGTYLKQSYLELIEIRLYSRLGF